ncbi:protein kinase [Streptomyces sp. NPDC050145]|uniref:protein kinase domain-containing protein n=1 Tax=Streptomyces sp. NPDC050145 TaxID=3365602 RepID=UPI0037B24A14
MSGSGGSFGHTVRVAKGFRIGHWEVREPLASGAFGTVYAARRARPSDTLPRTAALKFLPTGTRTPRQLSHLRELADREVQLLRRLRDTPRLVRLYETLTVDAPDQPGLDGATVLVLELAEGSLAGLLERTPAPPHAPELLAQVCQGLYQLHRAGWVHGDLKPANVLLLADGSVRLADFNMAAELDGTHAYTPAFATPDYTPPELLWAEIGERGQKIRPTADVWAFGVLAHLVLSGAFPLPGGTPAARRDAAVRYARGGDELRLAPGVPDAWRGIVTDCLARTHEERAALDAAELLRRVEAATGVRSARRPLGPRRRRVLAWAAGAVVAVLAAGGVTLALTGGGAPGDGTSGGDGKAAARYGASELRTDAGVPVRYRKLIVDAAHGCREPEVTPALIAAILKAESGFDPDLSDPGKDEYGIARWTPSVLWYWIDPRRRPQVIKDLRPPFPPDVSIPAVGRYACDIARQLAPPGRVEGERGVLVAVGYRTSAGTVNKEGGVPDRVRPYADRVGHWLKAYAPPPKAGQ